ncbi:MAG: dihydroorotate dehydrogenase electron transfer subunit [Deltaproteobacteria bacterium]|nr:dihydroorotate dehydrogenase electron transfer subunit [Deltaproteobacteria bacterium]
MKHILGKILENIELTEKHFLLTVKVKAKIPDVVPGQFVMVMIDDKKVFLRRPFTLYKVGEDTISIMYKVRGFGTNLLSRMKKGREISLLGPLGRGFALRNRDLYVIVAGGIGIAGVNLLIERMKGRFQIFYGTSSSKGLALIRNLISHDPIIATMDGSFGYKGDIISCLSQHIHYFSGVDFEILACGPKDMYVSLKNVLVTYRVPCQVLWEEKMGCGMGLCFGCAVKTENAEHPMKRVCLEGPVFDLWDLSL